MGLHGGIGLFTTIVLGSTALLGCDASFTLGPREEGLPLHVRGTVRSSEDGTPLEGALVAACGRQPAIGFGWCNFTSTGTDGSFEINDTIRAGFCPLGMSAGVEGFLPEKVPLDCGGPLQVVQYTLEPLSTLLVVVTPDSVRLGVGSTFQLSASVTRRDGRAVSTTLAWASSDTGVAQVDAEGTVTAVGPGEATITVGTGGAPGTASITVRAPGPVIGPVAWLATSEGVSIVDVGAQVDMGPPVDVGGPATSIAATPGGERVVVATAAGLAVLDARTRSVVASAASDGARARDVIVTPDGRRAYVACDDTDEILVYDLESVTLLKKIPAHDGPFAIALHPDGRHAYVAHAYAQEISVLDLAADTLFTRSIHTGARPQSLAISPDGKLLYVPLLFTAQLITISIASESQIGPPVPVGTYPGWVVLSPDGGRALVVSTGSKDVTVVDLVTGRAEARIPMGKTPWGGVAVTPDGATALVPIFSGELRLLDLERLRLLNIRLAVGREPNDVVVVR